MFMNYFQLMFTLVVLWVGIIIHTLNLFKINSDGVLTTQKCLNLIFLKFQKFKDK